VPFLQCNPISNHDTKAILRATKYSVQKYQDVKKDDSRTDSHTQITLCLKVIQFFKVFSIKINKATLL